MKSSYNARNGGTRRRIFHKSTGAAATAGRNSVIKRLEKQLQDGTKNIIDSGKISAIMLSESDVIRIQKELSTLKSRV